MPGTAIVRLASPPSVNLALDSDRVGAALLEGWGDSGSWQFILPWPEEVRELSWSAVGDWKAVLRELEDDVAGDRPPPFPFAGGWIGYVSYEATACEEAIAPRDSDPAEPPLFFARHRAGIAVAPDRTAFLFAPEGSEHRYTALLSAPPLPEPRAMPSAAKVVHDSLRDGLHRRLVAQIRDAIRNGDVYQVNLTRAFSCEYGGSAADLYSALIRPTPASSTAGGPPRSAAMIRGDAWSVVSASPEVFLLFDRMTGVAESRPIKGTMRRDGDDAAEIAALLASEKDAAEHLMIVDVVRNDFGKVAPPGRITVPAYRTVRTLPMVHHLESTVRAEDLHGIPLVDIMAALSPAASITGAPKRAAARMIRGMEPLARGVYCGAIGMVTGGGAAFSVAIRTAVLAGSTVRYHAGGGIVWESDPALEDEECRAKSAVFLRHVTGSAP